MEYSFIQLNDLPDEILIIILKKILNLEVLYSLIGVNHRLNTIAHDSIFTSHLTLMRYFSDDSIYPLSDPTLNRFCLQILPEIHHKIKWLDLESSSMERILLTTNYPNLCGLGLYNISIEKALSLFIDESSLTYINKNQISSLVVNIKYEKLGSAEGVRELIFTNIFTLFTNLQYLNFSIFAIYNKRLPLQISSSAVISSNLLELNVCVENFVDCLYLLDGRFNKLSTLYVQISLIRSSSLTISNKVDYFE
ncbi:unnamed protein product [Rotaria sp. Silwood2]|nr:unnamed protein product [Rotaria sp. Silwood2]